MSSKNSKNPKKNVVPGIVVLAAVMIFNLIADASGDDAVAIIAAIACVVVAVVVAVTMLAVKKAAGKGNAAGTARPAHAARQAPRVPLSAEHEEAVRCAHVRGKQKYIEQLDSYLKNGIIDKAEYKVLRERYEKLELPDDYH